MKNKVAIFFAIAVVAVVAVIFNYQKGEATPTRTVTTPVSAFNKVDAELSNANIEIKSGKQYQVIYDGKTKLAPKIKVKNGTLYLESSGSSVNINGNIFDLFNKKHSVVPLITIVLPKKELKDLSIDNSNGSFISKDIVISQADIDLSNGNVKIAHTTAQGYDLSTSNGYITVNGEKFSDEYSKNASANRVLDIQTSNGNIDIER